MAGRKMNVPYALHTLGINTDTGLLNTPCDCPNPECRHPASHKKCYINIENGKWNCFACGEHGNNVASYLSVRDQIEWKEAYKLLIKGQGTASAAAYEAKIPEKRTHASLEDTDKTLRALAKMFPLTEEHKQSLISRGFDEDAIKYYGFFSFPEKDEAIKQDITNITKFRDICFNLRAQGCVLKDVAGFYPNPSSDHDFCFNWPKVGFNKTWHTKGIAIPQITIEGKWCGIQVRFDDEVLKDVTVKENPPHKLGKCIWLSSSNKPGGTSPLTGVHFATRFAETKNGTLVPMVNTRVIITEGAMKADLIHALQPTWPVISIAGVNATRGLEETLKKLHDNFGVKDIVDAFDMDYVKNPQVEKAMENLKKVVEKVGMTYHFGEWSTKTSDKDGNIDCLKGLDDYLAYKLKGIIRN